MTRRKKNSGKNGKKKVPVAVQRGAARKQMRSPPSKVTYSNQVAIRGHPKTRFSGSSNGGDLTVSGCEYFDSVNVHVDFIPWKYRINPFNGTLFPKLSAMAGMFEEFRIKSLVVKYIPACPTTRSGSVIFLIDYDPSDPAPNSVLEAMANESSVQGSVGMPLSIQFDNANQREKWFYVSNSVSFSPADLPSSSTLVRQSCPGTIHVISTAGASADEGAIGGYLEVTYSIEFRAYRPPPELFATITSQANGQSLSTTGGQILPLRQFSAYGYTGLAFDEAESFGFPGHEGLNGQLAFIVGSGTWILGWDWNLGAVSTDIEEKKQDSGKVRQLRSPYYRYKQDEKTHLHLGTKNGQDWELVPSLPQPSKPQTSGDYDLLVNIVYEDGSTGTIDNVTGNNASAFVYGQCVIFATTQRSAVYWAHSFADTRKLISWGATLGAFNTGTD